LIRPLSTRDRVTVGSNANLPMNRTNGDAELRRFPYPYRAMLAICSDLDSTLDRHVYLEIMRFLNTTEATAMGQGVGLEVGNSIHFRAIPPQFSYWDTDDAGREMVQTLIRTGHIDCLHSFGELIYTRDEAKKALDELAEHDCRLKVWVDHGGAVTNFGSDIMKGHGDEIGRPAYHADLTIDYGIKYIWCGRTTSIIGQDTPPRSGGIFNWNHPVVSGRTLLKEVTKRRLARLGNKKYAMHLTNKVLRTSVLRDGSSVYEFMRCNPHWRGIGFGDQGRYIGEVLTSDFLNRLIDRGGTCILYTHLGKIDDPNVPFNYEAVEAFHRLSEAFQGGSILVTTTRRFLGYQFAVREISFSSSWDGKHLYIAVDTRTDENSPCELPADDLAGLTFYVPDPEATCLTVNGEHVRNLQRNPSDHRGRPSVSLPWPALEFPGI